MLPPFSPFAQSAFIPGFKGPSAFDQMFVSVLTPFSLFSYKYMLTHHTGQGAAQTAPDLWSQRPVHAIPRLGCGED